MLIFCILIRFEQTLTAQLKVLNLIRIVLLNRLIIEKFRVNGGPLPLNWPELLTQNEKIILNALI